MKTETEIEQATGGAARCPHCNEAPHALEECPASQDLETTRRMLLEARRERDELLFNFDLNRRGMAQGQALLDAGRWAGFPVIEGVVTELEESRVREKALREVLIEAKKTISAAQNDIGEHLQVAKYNLRGQINSGEIIERPTPPLLVHEAGIAASEEVIERCRKTWLQVYSALSQPAPSVVVCGDGADAAG